MGKSVGQIIMVCLNIEGYEASLEKRKLYVALADDEGAKHKLVRIIDESGEDYLFPVKFFPAVELPPRVRRAVVQSA
jgi:hypothetical protein